MKKLLLSMFVLLSTQISFAGGPNDPASIAEAKNFAYQHFAKKFNVSVAEIAPLEYEFDNFMVGFHLSVIVREERGTCYYGIHYSDKPFTVLRPHIDFGNDFFTDRVSGYDDDNTAWICFQ